VYRKDIVWVVENRDSVSEAVNGRRRTETDSEGGHLMRRGERWQCIGRTVAV
jgi:hypothetical protein